MYEDRVEIYKEIESKRDSKVLLYVTGDRPGWETSIAIDIHDFMVDHLDEIYKVNKITLILHTKGGDILAAWRIINLIKQFCNIYEVIIPRNALSAGTLISLGAENIIMTKQAALGPIDPSINTPLNPEIPGAQLQSRLPVSVEEVKSYISMAKEELGTNDASALSPVFIKLSEHVHPLVLGRSYRTRSQIQFLAKKLLKNQLDNEEDINNVISFLCSDSGSHDYSIDRAEAKNDLKLNIEKPDDEFYSLIKTLHDDYKNELLLNEPWDPRSYLGSENEKNYSFKRCLLESIGGGCHSFISEGKILKNVVTMPPNIQQEHYSDTREFESWKKIS